MGKSLVQQIAELPPEEAEALLDEMTPEQRAALASWAGQARPEQLPPPGSWSYWGMIGGRGSGKTRGAGEWICDRIEEGKARWVGFIGRTAADCRRIQVEGESGFIACAERRGMRVIPQPSRAQLVVDGEVVVMLYSADEPDSLRGPQHDTLWGDEFAAWAPKKDAVGNTAFTNAQAGLRLGDDPQGVFSTTPRPIPEVRAAIKNKSGLWVLTRMTTWDNTANLAPSFIATLREQFEGTRLAAQEFEGEFLEDVEGALWTHEGLHRTRVAEAPALPNRAIAVDPSVAEQGEGDECGIVAGGVGDDREFYVVADHSTRGSTHEWARIAVNAYYAFGAQVMIVEVNNGGSLVTAAVHNIDSHVRIEPVRAADSKRARAEPIAMLWQQERAHMVGEHAALEGQLTSWSNMSKTSPDRLDALVWLGHWAKDRMRVGGAEFVAPTPTVLPEPTRMGATAGAVPGGPLVGVAPQGRSLAAALLERHRAEPRRFSR